MPQEGLMVQLDTSEHLWLPFLDKKLQLILLVDDATNKLLDGQFALSDSTLENMKLLERFFRQKGLPVCIYLDQDSKFKTSRYVGIHYNLKGQPYPDTHLDGANHYLKEEFIPKWNRKFAREAKIKELAYRVIPKKINLNDILCIKEERTVYPDNTISYKTEKYQILPDPWRASYTKAKVGVYEHLNAKVSISYKGRKLKFKKIGNIKN